MNCNQVRSKIRAYINSGEMKVGQFQDKLGVSSKSYGEFMGQNGPDKGAFSSTYHAGWEFFKKLELAGVKMPRKKKAKTEDIKDGKKSQKDGEKKQDVSDIHLDGEETGNVPIYDTCDEVRRKINAQLRDTSMTQAAFLREIAKGIPGTPNLSSQRLKTFLNSKGPRAGNDSPIFYAAYVWFEKLRVKDGKKKSKKREEMEKVWAREGGMDRIAPKGGWLCRSPPTVDQYGQVHFRD
jgi:hypothetical protein